MALDKYLWIVNKNNHFDKKDLEKFDLLPTRDTDGKTYIETQTEQAYLALREHMIENYGIALYLTSAGRTIQTQQKVFDEYRAEHTEGFNSAEFSCLDGNITGEVSYGNSRGDDIALVYVLRACNYLRYLATNIYLVDPEVVGVGVALHFNDLGNYYVLYILAKYLIALYLGAGVGHSVAVFLCGDTVCVCKIVKPFK